MKSQLARNLENSLSNPQAIATGALNTAISQGDWRLMFLQHDWLEEMQPADWCASPSCISSRRIERSGTTCRT